MMRKYIKTKTKLQTKTKQYQHKNKTKTETKLQTKSLLNELTGFVWFEQHTTIACC
jgi:hypothetical protein